MLSGLLAALRELRRGPLVLQKPLGQLLLADLDRRDPHFRASESGPGASGAGRAGRAAVAVGNVGAEVRSWFFAVACGEASLGTCAMWTHVLRIGDGAAAVRELAERLPQVEEAKAFGRRKVGIVIRTRVYWGRTPRFWPLFHVQEDGWELVEELMVEAGTASQQHKIVFP